MKILYAALVLVLGVSFSVLAAIASFGKPETVQEKALNAILKHADNDTNQLDNLFHRSHDVTESARVDYREMLSRDLLNAMQAEEKKQVQSNCGGKYIEGEICGLNFSPITCSQDSVGEYLYRTEQHSADKSIITYKWYEDQNPIATYHLIADAGHWKIDGIACLGQTSFNVKRVSID